MKKELKEDELKRVSGGTLTQEAMDWYTRNEDEILNRGGGIAVIFGECYPGEISLEDLKTALKIGGNDCDDLL